MGTKGLQAAVVHVGQDLGGCCGVRARSGDETFIAHRSFWPG